MKRAIEFLIVVLTFLAWRPVTGWAAPTCAFQSTGPLSFGAYNVFDTTALASTATIAYVCQPKIVVNPPIISASTGNGTYAARYMLNGTNRLYYNLFVDAAATTIFGNGSAGTATLTGELITKPDHFGSATVYGRVPAGQDVSAGAYTDTLVITINF